MNKISNIISMPIISIYEGKCIGIAYNIAFDFKLKKCKYVLILDDNENTMSVLNFKDIYSIGKDCIFIKNTTLLTLQENFSKELEDYKSLINYKTYNLKGEYLGKVQDIEINNLYKITQIYLDNGQTIKSNSIANIGNIILTSNESIKINKFKPQLNSVYNSTSKVQDKVVILSNFSQLKTENQNKIITDFRFLIGRILSKDIIAINGEMIAKNGSIITKDIVNKASFYGKLVEVARYSDKKLN